ncbi:MAG: tetratricopeptide repeat protein [Janthinobacterium lividum]
MKLDLERNSGTSFSEGYMHLENGRYAEAEKIFRSIVKSDPLDATSYYHLGNAFRGLGKQGQALESYIAAIKLDEAEAAYYYGAACCCFSLGFHEEGVKSLQMSVAAPSQKQKIFCKTTNKHETNSNEIANQNQHVRRYLDEARRFQYS